MDPELNLHLTRMWVSQPVIFHAMLLYRERRLQDGLSTENIDEVRKEFLAFVKFSEDRLGLKGH